MPDLAFVAPGGDREAELITGVGKTMTKIRVKGPVGIADVGKLPFTGQSTLITTSTVNGQTEWSSMNLVTGQKEVFSVVPGNGRSVQGCYYSNRYSAAAYVVGRRSTTLRVYTGEPDVVFKLPGGVKQARCGPPINGNSPVYSVVSALGGRVTNVLGFEGDKRILNSPRINKRYTDISLGVIPQSLGQQAAVMILAKMGKQQFVEVLDSKNSWRRLKMPKIPKGARFSDFGAVQVGTQTFIVLQITTATNQSVYKSVLVPSGYLGKVDGRRIQAHSHHNDVLTKAAIRKRRRLLGP